jgi:hypothetical protein
MVFLHHIQVNTRLLLRIAPKKRQYLLFPQNFIVESNSLSRTYSQPAIPANMTAIPKVREGMDDADTFARLWLQYFDTISNQSISSSEVVTEHHTKQAQTLIDNVRIWNESILLTKSWNGYRKFESSLQIKLAVVRSQGQYRASSLIKAWLFFLYSSLSYGTLLNHMGQYALLQCCYRTITFSHQRISMDEMNSLLLKYERDINDIRVIINHILAYLIAHKYSKNGKSSLILKLLSAIYNHYPLLAFVQCDDRLIRACITHLNSSEHSKPQAIKVYRMFKACLQDYDLVRSLIDDCLRSGSSYDSLINFLSDIFYEYSIKAISSVKASTENAMVDEDKLPTEDEEDEVIAVAMEDEVEVINVAPVPMPSQSKDTPKEVLDIIIVTINKLRAIETKMALKTALTIAESFACEDSLLLSVS